MTSHPYKSKVDELRDALKTRGTTTGASDRASSPPAEIPPEPLEGAPTDEKSYGDIEAQIRAAEEEAKSHYDKLLRVMAEFENFKKRIQKEKEEHLQYSNERLLKELLPVLDDLDRVLEHLPEVGTPEVEALAEGIGLVRKNMCAALEKCGLKEVAGHGAPFDPAVHEAIATGSTDGASPDTVMAVHRKGYLLFDRLLRPAMVTVAK